MTTIPSVTTDPCGRADALRAVRDELIVGEGVQEVEFMGGNGTRRRVRYGTASLDRLDREIEQAQAACDRSKGKRGGRFVIGGRA